MMDGNNVTISIGDNVMVDNATVTIADIVCTNGVIHVIDGLLFSESSSLEEESLNYSVFPNPSNGQITVSNSSNESYNIKILNTLGEVILTETLNGNKVFDLNKYGKGIYLIEMFNNHSIKTERVIIE